jgi:hypothetical protein
VDRKGRGLCVAEPPLPNLCDVTASSGCVGLLANGVRRRGRAAPSRGRKLQAGLLTDHVTEAHHKKRKGRRLARRPLFIVQPMRLLEKSAYGRVRSHGEREAKKWGASPRAAPLIYRRVHYVTQTITEITSPEEKGGSNVLTSAFVCPVTCRRTIPKIDIIARGKVSHLVQLSRQKTPELNAVNKVRAVDLGTTTESCSEIYNMSKLKATNPETKDDVLLAIINRAWKGEVGGRLSSSESTEHVMQIVPFHVKRTCVILEWLGLVEPDDQHAFGYKPTRHLMPLVQTFFLFFFEHPLKFKIERRAYPEDIDCLYCIYEAAVPHHMRLEDDGYHLEEKVLYTLGLATWTNAFKTVPTARLRRLAARIRNEARGWDTAYPVTWSEMFGEKKASLMRRELRELRKLHKLTPK